MRFPVAIGYREKTLRIYNLEDECITMEENNSRTAGAKVYCCPRLFSGAFCYQGDNITTIDSVVSSCSYVALGASENDVFVIPMPNRHEVILWDLAVCPSTGSLLSVGADGLLYLALTGRLSPRASENDFNFNAGHSLMLLKRKNRGNDKFKVQNNLKGLDYSDTEQKEVSEGCQPLRDPAFNLDVASRQSYLEISFAENVVDKNLPLYSLDIRFESLNRVAVSEVSGKLAICGGEAGLLFFLPF